ncbi:MAG: T9SS type A sorting domain-containing protein [Saprospiraceae bacterium]
MIQRLLLFSFLFSTLSLLAQTQEPHPCGSLSHRSDWLKKYQANPNDFPKSDNVIYVPLKIHITGVNGIGFYPLSKLYDSMCALNEQFEGTDMYFYIDGEINYIDDARYHRHDSVQEGALMMFEYNVPNALNCYIVGDPAGNCGYNLPYAGVALAPSCIDADNESTWAHEIGHAFSLPHPFLGWEGGQTYDGSTPPNFSQPAPEFVTYDYTYFQDIYIDIDTLIIDTAMVEKMDGSNCAEAADGFCDTKPDYIAQRWDCNGNGESPQSQIDPNGVSFRSDASLYMSYAFDACAGRFSDEQVAAMRANLMDEHPELVNLDYVVQEVDATAPIEPLADAFVAANNAFFQWEAVEGATTYLLQVSRLPAFSGGNSSITQTILVEGNTYVLDNLADDKTYYWHVRPLNNGYFCTEFTETIKFETSEATAVATISEVNDFTIIPNITTANSTVQVALNSSKSFTAQLRLLNVNGQEVQLQQLSVSQGTQHISLKTNNLSKGMYFVVLQKGTEQVVEKLIVQ